MIGETGNRLRCLIGIAFIASITLILMVGMPSASAGGEDANLHSVQISATPSTQGVGGIVTVRAVAQLYGGCCYNLYADDLTAELTLPDGVILLGGPSPERYASVTAQPGGVATERVFEWTVRSKAVGVYDLDVVVRSRNCGNVKDNVTLEYVEGAAISEPALFPDPPDMRMDLFVSVNVSIAIRDVTVVSVSVYTVEGAREFVKAENETLILEGNRSVAGTFTVLTEHEYQKGIWWTRLEPPDSERIVLWVVVVGSDGKNTTSPVYSLRAIDRDRDYQELRGLYMASTFIPLLGAIAVIYVNNRLLAKRLEPILIRRGRASEIMAMRAMVFYAVLTIGVIMVLYALSAGWFQETGGLLQEGI